MPELQTLATPAGFYDHEADADLGLPRRSAVADWGADELFHGAIRRRRSARASAPVRRASGPHREPHRAAVADALAAMAGSEPLHAPEPPGAAARDRRRPESPAAAASGRRRPAPAVEVAASARRRPAPAVEEHIGHRPDHVAAWAFAMGVLFILLAILTA